MDGGDEEQKQNKPKEDEGPNGCIKCLEATWTVIYGIYSAIKFVIMTICNTIAYCWYPTKERCVNCCNNCHNRMNPHDDEGYSAFE